MLPSFQDIRQILMCDRSIAMMATGSEAAAMADLIEFHSSYNAPQKMQCIIPRKAINGP